MRRSLCIATGRFEVAEVKRPVPGPGEVLVRVRNCGVCGSDLHWFRGEFPPPSVCPGHEIAGEVAELGAGVANLSPGDRVAVEPLVVCGECPYCLAGDYQLCLRFSLLGTMRDGGFADYVVAPRRAVFTLPAGLDFEVGALTEPTAVCVHAVRLAHLRLGDRVLVLGAGTIGLLSVLAARAAGAAEVAVTARHAHQAELARRCGATQVFPTTAEGDAARAVLVSRHPFDVVIETVGGRAETLDEAMQAVRPGGTVVVLGVFSHRPACDALLLVVREIRVVGSLTYGRCGLRADFDLAMGLLVDQASVARQLITHRFALDAVQQAFETATEKRQDVVKVTVSP